MINQRHGEHRPNIHDESVTADNANTGDHQIRRRPQRSPTVQIPRTRSTGHLLSSEPSEISRLRYSFDASSAADYDAMTRSPIITEHDHGLGVSGLRRIRQQHPPNRTPTLPSSRPHSRCPTGAGTIFRSSSVNLTLTNPQPPTPPPPFSLSQSTLDFSEDLTRFPSESLHSFSFAHQSEDFLYNRQNVLKRSLEFMKDRMGWSVSSSAAALASAQARVTGDVEAQNALDLLARAQLINAGNLPSHNNVANHTSNSLVGPLTGPAFTSGENPFENHFLRRSGSPEALLSPATRNRPAGKLITGFDPSAITEEPSDLSDEERERRGCGRVGAESSESSGRTPTNESHTTVNTSPPLSRPVSLKRTMTDTLTIAVQERLMDTMAQPYLTGRAAAPPSESDAVLSPTASQSGSATNFQSALGPTVHGHTNRWVPAAQAIFTTQAKPPWTILAANDLACLVFGVTKGEIRKVGILEVVQEERRDWLERKLLRKDDDDDDGGGNTKVTNGGALASNGAPRAPAPLRPAAAATSALLGGRSGITAQLLNKPNSRSQTPKNLGGGGGGKRPSTVHGGDPKPPEASGVRGHQRNRANSVILCGDVVPIQKRNGATGSASLWVKEKKVGLIWVLEEIHEDVAFVVLEEEGTVRAISGAAVPIWGLDSVPPDTDVNRLIPRIPRQGIDPSTGEIDFAQIARRRFFTCPNAHGVSVPCTIEQVRGRLELRVSSFPHMAGIVVVCPDDLRIRSSNSVFCGALFGYGKPDGMSVNTLVPDFDKILDILTEDDGIEFVDGMVVPEHSFRKAAASLGLREGRPDAASCFLRPEGLPAVHRDGSHLKIDVQMRVVKSEKKKKQRLANKEGGNASVDEEAPGGHYQQQQRENASAPILQEAVAVAQEPELVFALWITYSRHLHAKKPIAVAADVGLTRSEASSPLHQPSPGQTSAQTPREMTPDLDDTKRVNPFSSASTLTRQIKDAALSAAAKLTGGPRPVPRLQPQLHQQQQQPLKPDRTQPTRVAEPAPKKNIDDFTILEDMGQGAYGQVKLARYKNTGRKVILKYVTKRRILVDTWTRDRKLGTVPLEIHVLNFLRRPDLRHPNIVEMESFFEDEINYYIEMVPHGLPGMDLFDYIELRSNMGEDECRNIFVQVARAVHHLHTKAQVVHRDIKDENVILDGEGNIKLIDFGSAAYIKSGPFDVFVGTIDYAAPEVLAGRPYKGKEQDVWALGILLYTIIYKENPFYSIDEIMDRDLRVPFTISDDSIDLVRHMLDRDVAQRYTIEQVIEHPWCRTEDDASDES